MKRLLLFVIFSIGLAADLMGQAAADSDFRFSYTLPSGSPAAILPDGIISFPDTTVNLANPNQRQTTSATFVIANRGLLQGTVNNIATAGGAFKLSSLPVLPAAPMQRRNLRTVVG